MLGLKLWSVVVGCQILHLLVYLSILGGLLVLLLVQKLKRDRRIGLKARVDVSYELNEI